MNVNVRPEQPADYAAIAHVNALAFAGRAAEPAIVALLRHSPRFDPALSLVAEVGGHVVGHVLFVPYSVQLLGQPVPAVNLAPLAVLPAYQRQGIGGRLIAAGHAAARDRGYAFSFLLGHPSYYPRFGCRTHAYGASTLVVEAPAAGWPAASHLSSRAPLPDDLPALAALWRAAEANVDFALDPGAAWLDWVSPNPAISARVFLHGDRLVAYARFHRASPARPRVFLAESAAVTRAVAALLGAAAGTPQVVVPVHPASAASLPGASCTAWEAGMACPLRPSPLDDYLAALAAGTRPPGCVTWPVAFDVAE